MPEPLDLDPLHALTGVDIPVDNGGWPHPLEQPIQELTAEIRQCRALAEAYFASLMVDDTRSMLDVMRAANDRTYA